MPAVGDTTLVVGCRGRMGAMLCSRAAEKGLAVAGIDMPYDDDALAPACENAGAAVFCVPAAVLDDVLARICPFLPEGCVVSDITSVKVGPMRAMEKIWDGPVVGTHPLFGPKPDPAGDLPVAVIPGRGADEGATAHIEGFFGALGFRVFRSTAEEHDRAMACIQNMNFVTNVAYFALLAGHDELLPYLTPSFRRRMDAARKMLTEDGPMFCGLFEANEHSHEAVRRYRSMLNIAAAGDMDLLYRKAQWWWQGDDAQDRQA